MNVYLSGPMRGIPQFNFPAFFEAAAKLRTQGYHVFSPAERDDEVYGDKVWRESKQGDLGAAVQEGFSLREALCDDMRYICLEADAIAMLPGWENSKGAKAEKATAEALGLLVLFL